MSRLTVTLDELPGLVGRDLGESEYLEITQERINGFAAATDDDQWIHTDPVRAKDGPFGAPIAHGFLTLSLVVPFWTELFDVENVSAKLNYGLDRVRFTSPVVVGSRVRMHSVIESVEEVKGGYQLTTTNTIQIEGQERPAVVATFIARFLA
jgi:acyl dehydratase